MATEGGGRGGGTCPPRGLKGTSQFRLLKMVLQVRRGPHLFFAYPLSEKVSVGMYHHHGCQGGLLIVVV